MQASILIRTDSMTSEESKVKTVCKYLICGTSYEHLNQLSSKFKSRSNPYK